MKQVTGWCLNTKTGKHRTVYADGTEAEGLQPIMCEIGSVAVWDCSTNPATLVRYEKVKK